MSFSSHTPLLKIIAPAALAQPLPPLLTNLSTAMLVGTGDGILFPGKHFALLFPSSFFLFSFFFFHFGPFSSFSLCLCYRACKGCSKPLGKGCLEHTGLAPSLTSKFRLDFLLLSFQLL